MPIPGFQAKMERLHEERMNMLRLLRQRATRLWNVELEEVEHVYDQQMEITSKDAEDAISYVRTFFNPESAEHGIPGDPMERPYNEVFKDDKGNIIATSTNFTRQPFEKWRVPPGLGSKEQASKLRNIIEFAEDSYFRLRNVTIKEKSTKPIETTIAQGIAYNREMDINTTPDSNQMTIFMEAATHQTFKKAEMTLDFYPIGKDENYPLEIPNNALKNAIENEQANKLFVASLLQNTEDNIRSFDHQYAVANVGNTLQDYINEKGAKYAVLTAIREELSREGNKQLLLEDKRGQNAQTKEKVGKLKAFKTKVSEGVKKKYTALKDVIGGLTEEERRVMKRMAITRTLGYGLQMRYSYLNSEVIRSPNVMFGPVLLYSVQMIERAKSDRKLKNRALGDVFLAHQKGNRDICRIDGTLMGPQRFIMLALMVKLQKDGEGFVTDLGSKEGVVFDSTAPPAQAEIQKSEKQQFNYEEHRTLPLVTRTHVMLNMYLQTLEWHRSIEDGQDIIKYHLLFRKHVPSTAWRAFNPQKYTDDEGKPRAGAGYQLLDSRAQVRRWLEYSLDMAWKLERTMGEAYLHMMINSGGNREVDTNKRFAEVGAVLTGYQGNMLGVY